ncbi:precorrin-3B synthase [Pseudomonas sp. LRF_L74]|uniref:precorrin-3B synthase n=1 Tax=Pseudomonas sp. LRF_L74 TaxID=3369422 RepID=UPI003F60EE5C
MSDSLTSIRPSACPGLLRIVPALDGGICRVKLAGGVLSSAQARAIAGAAQAHASGVLELTNRSNLQIRGVRDDRQRALIDRLLAAGLGPRNAAADDVRNVLLSPAAGLDAQALLDIRPLAASLLALLEDTPAFHALSPKFALQLDGGEALAMREHAHDLWLRAVPGERLAFGLAGCPQDAPLAAVAAEQAVTLVAAVLELFLELAGSQHARMRQLLATLSPQAFIDALRARLPFELHPASPAVSPRSEAGVPLGVHAQHQAGMNMLLVGARLGRIDAIQLQGLADLAERHGDGSLRLTPWQGVLLPNVGDARLAELRQALVALGLLVDASEPLAQLIACTGSSACAKGLADTKGDARRLAVALQNSGKAPGVHLCGCARSCSAAHVAPFTLLAQAEDSYRLYQRDSEASGFGRLLAPSLSIEEAGAWFAASAKRS